METGFWIHTQHMRLPFRRKVFAIGAKTPINQYDLNQPARLQIGSETYALVRSN